MHDYYRRNEKKYLKQIETLLSYARSETEELFHADFASVLKEVQTIFSEQFLLDAPYVGGSKNANDTANLIGACEYSALFVCGRNHGIPDEETAQLLTIMAERQYEPLSDGMQTFVRKLLDWKMIHKFLRQFAAKSEKYSAIYSYAWRYEYKEPDEVYSHKVDCTRCGNWLYLKEKGLGDIVPYMCNLDFVSFCSFGLPYYRDKVIAYGDEVCSNQFKRNALPPTKHWPPHGLRGDGLK